MELPFTEMMKTAKGTGMGVDQELSLDMLPLRCLLDVYVEVLHEELNTRIQSPGEKFDVEGAVVQGGEQVRFRENLFLKWSDRLQCLFVDGDDPTEKEKLMILERRESLEQCHLEGKNERDLPDKMVVFRQQPKQFIWSNRWEGRMVSVYIGMWLDVVAELGGISV